MPSDVPTPFSGEPAISASSGYYNLYWLIPGSPPTFLSITGEAGGTIPDYSKYDRNVQLTANASVNGADAYHDLTPIYDLVYWKVNGVVYSVESRNMTGTDSLSLANSLVVLTPPAAPEPTATDTVAPDVSGNASSGNASAANASDGNSSGSASAANASSNSGNASADSNSSNSSGNGADSSKPAIDAPLIVDPGTSVDVTITGSNGSTLKADAGIFTATDRDSIIDVADTTLSWESPSPDKNQTITFQLVDPGSGDVVASAQSIVATDANQVVFCPSKVSSDKDADVILRGSGTLTVKADAGEFPKNAINANFSSAGGASLTGAMPDAGAVKLDWKAPKLQADGKANLTVTDDGGAKVGSCAITVSKLKSATPTSLQTSDGTDLRVTGVGAVKEGNAAPASTIAAGSSDDGSGMVVPVTPPPGSTPTPVPTQPPPTPTRTPTPSVQPTATLAPTLDTSGMVSQVIGPDGGQLSCPSGATITIPAGPAARRELQAARAGNNRRASRHRVRHHDRRHGRPRDRWPQEACPLQHRLAGQEMAVRRNDLLSGRHLHGAARERVPHWRRCLGAG
ncbi:MAG: hypothetical protein J0H25_12265 [Rhizobiales bacterium]|nr:hypothetical protein [Hyphomicrobiales bacterium]